MILVLDVGNTNTVIGAMKDAQVIHHWRISTIVRTTDEVGMLLLQLVNTNGLSPKDITGICVSCVVPSVVYSIEKASREYFNLQAIIIGRGIKTGMRIRTDNPREVGADRIVNSVAAFHHCQSPAVVVDFGTATTLDCITANGDYIGGVIAPGFRISAEALFNRAAMLPKVEVERPERVIGTNTIHSMQSGLFWGYVGLVNSLAKRCKAELREKAPELPIHCIATGGLSNLIGRACVEIDDVDTDLTLFGLWLLYHKNLG
jgi:type III pantothenate kinase